MGQLGFAGESRDGFGHLVTLSRVGDVMTGRGGVMLHSISCWFSGSLETPERHFVMPALGLWSSLGVGADGRPVISRCAWTASLRCLGLSSSERESEGREI